MKKQHKHAELIKQWADGAEIQVRVEDEWCDVFNHTWGVSAEYRVKPKKWTPKLTLAASEYIYVNYKNYEGVSDVSDDVKNYWKLTKFVEEFEQDWDNQNYEVYRSDIDNSFTVVDMYRDTTPSLGVIRMSENCARKLCEMLNNGEIEL